MRVHRHHFFISLIIIVLGGIAAFHLLNRGLYPVVIVNASFIPANIFDRITWSALNFYIKAADTYEHKKLVGENLEKLRIDIMRATLDQLITQSIVSRAFIGRFGNEGEEYLRERMKNIQTSVLQPAVNDLYGLSSQEFNDLVLRPQAMKELLSDDFAAKQENFLNWLENQRAEAFVAVLLPGFSWKDVAIAVQ